MDINIKGNPGTGNTFTEVNIGTVQNYNPNATTVINNNYCDKPKPQPATEKVMEEAQRQQVLAEIMDYVDKLTPYVAKDWKNRYDGLWKQILALPDVDAIVYIPGKQKNTSFNRNLIANIIYIMCMEGVITGKNATALTIILEGDKEHAVRAQLATTPESDSIATNVRSIIRG